MDNENIGDSILDKPYIFLLAGVMAIYLGKIEIFKGNLINEILNFFLIMGGAMYIILSIFLYYNKNKKNMTIEIIDLEGD